MATYTFDPSSDQPTPEQQAAEAAALEQGEKLAQIQEEDRNRRFEQAQSEDENPALIGGKFKSQDDLLKAYEELQRKLSSGEESSEEVEAPEGRVDEEVQAEEQQPEEVGEAESIIVRASKAYEESGELSEESIEELSKLDSKELIKAYLSQYQKQSAALAQQRTSEEATNTLINEFGGKEKYAEMISWASSNLSPEEIAQYNEATNAGTAAARFAIAALQQRYVANEGYEAPLVTGRKAAPGVQPYRSNAELARDLADPRYHNDPAFRSDVEARLSRSGELL